ncbi:hypothetical protein [Marinimicrobium locisalis]|uniref:hypothetical protein n=1 Tax=Marinimicrobium locisalis TaxID=546022 RepID=UPI00322155A1
MASSHNSEEPQSANAERFESLLPYAPALGVEDAWTSRLTRAVGVLEVEAVAVNRQLHPLYSECSV